ncbi:MULTISPECIES: DUF3558 domain-containing protein [unclassified Streptomyces]|uniref:DUF3558 domain-containing protein n=1 Tax=unclassified Streptomyces TaxID=2593676 RepID=UPI002024EA55|nr:MULTISPECIES: DUF3558 domain-containing protein [unclassified Streptomyces]MCX4549068.1 DUF3558 domain-containing protein [Streptomyces sp. NBC_01500]WSC20645.1 DUF3558 domain-containing protein [Streptomyces sp. NBC_01766]WSV54674.1 DUF3558 domain-containing protein [Streptomyces sp. NBC_01014]
MQRRAYVPGLVLLAALVTGCTSGSGADGSTADSKPGETIPAAAPGKYLTLREPCRTADQGVLKTMFPEIADLPKEQQEKAYAGTPEPTFDTDRRVGCRWKGDSPTEAHRLRISMERVVSYDTAVSDDDRAKALFEQRQTAASVSVQATPNSTPPDGAQGGDGDGGTPADLRPRTLDGLGSAAFLDDIPAKPDAGTPQHTVRVVFRASNVLVTVEYSETPTDRAALPDIQGLQEMTRSMAHKLAEQISE